MATVQSDGYEGYYFPECPHADNKNVNIKNCKCKALEDAPGAASGTYWCGVAQSFNRCPFDRKV
jgi:hypothetical protein